MQIDVKINRRHEQNTSRWSGGTTTQLAIYPESSLYNKRDFLWRISTAVVEDEESVFTSLSGYERILMILEGRLELNHEGHYRKTLTPFETDKFSGDWKTTSRGKVRDFNLMFKAGCSGAMKVLRVNHGLTVSTEKPNLDNAKGQVAVCFYLYRGSLNLNIPGHDCCQLMSGDFAMLTVLSADDVPLVTLSNINEEEAVVIQTTVIY